jgi:aspartyl-tRNA synthetase
MTDVSDLFTPEIRSQLGMKDYTPVLAIRIPKVGTLSRKERDEIKTWMEEQAKSTNARGNIYDFARFEKSLPEIAAAVRARSEAKPDDLLVPFEGLIKPGPHPSESTIPPAVKQHDFPVYTAAGALRLALAQKYRDRHGAFVKQNNAEDYRFLWVTDFPMFEWDEGERRWNAAHHPFTSPHEQDMDKLESDPGAVRALAYDIVLNGTELGSGSIRIHRQDIQKTIFRALGMTDEEARSRFGFFLEALEYGTPPHGGIALGLDRIVMILAGAESLREVIPFPKTAKARDEMVDAPTPVNPSQLKELGIQIKAHGESAR